MRVCREKAPGVTLVRLRPYVLPASVKALSPTLGLVLLKLRYIGSCVCAGIGPVSAGVGRYSPGDVWKILQPQLNPAQVGVEKARHGAVRRARNLEVGGSGGHGRRYSGPAGTGGPALPCGCGAGWLQ